MTTKTKIAITAIATFSIFMASLFIDSAIRQNGGFLASVGILPLGYLILMSIVVFIGDIKGLFDYAWIVHAIQFSIYGILYGRYWIRTKPLRGVSLVIALHILIILAYAGAALLWERSRR